MDCLFCKIAKKEMDGKILYEDEDICAFLDIDQKTGGHTLVIPKKHVTDIMEVDDETLLKMFHVAKKLQPMLMEKLNKKASTLLINYGDSQVIKHLHLHILPTALHEKNTLSEDEIYQKLKDEI